MPDDPKSPSPGSAPTEPASSAPKKKSPLRVVGVVIAVVGAGFGAAAFAGRGHETTDNAQVEADVVNVTSRVSAPVARIAVTDNQVVKKGDVLIELDSADLEVKRKQAEADLEAARAQAAIADAQIRITDATSKGGLQGARAALEGTTAASRNADAQIEAARAAAARAKTDVERLQADADRADSLFKVGGATKVGVDNAHSALQTALSSSAQAEAQLASALEAKKAAESRIGEAAARVEQSAPVDAQAAVAHAQADLAHARVKASEAALETATLQVSYAVVKAPVDGVLSKIAVRAGQNLSAGQLVVAVVPAHTFVVANFKETQVGGIHTGQHADIKIDSLGGKHLSGKVVSVSPATGARFALLPPDNASGNFVKVVQRVPVRIDWDNANDGNLAAGLSAEVTVDVTP